MKMFSSLVLILGLTACMQEGTESATQEVAAMEADVAGAPDVVAADDGTGTVETTDTARRGGGWGCCSDECCSSSSDECCSSSSDECCSSSSDECCSDECC